jgi:hypothetical protein
MWANKQIAADHQFVRLPPDGKLEPGMTWAVPSGKINIDCAKEVPLNYKAISENGPVANLVIDGRDTEVATIHIYYEAWIENCEAGSWKKTIDVLYAPALNEIISSKSLNYVKSSINFIDGGGGWAITAIKTGGK